MTDEHYIRTALREAQKAFDSGEVPVGAVIVQEGQILGRAYNQVEILGDPTAHAEILALTSAFNRLGSKYLPGATIYITVEPCLMCAGALYWSKIGRIVYGGGDEKNGYRRHCNCRTTPDGLQEPWPFHPRTTLTSGVLGEECAALMKEFFRSRR